MRISINAPAGTLGVSDRCVLPRRVNGDVTLEAVYCTRKRAWPWQWVSITIVSSFLRVCCTSVAEPRLLIVREARSTKLLVVCELQGITPSGQGLYSCRDVTCSIILLKGA